MKECEDRKDYEQAGYATKAMGVEKASRERTWDESTIEERIQRLRRTTQETRAWLEMVAGQLQHVPEHQHSAQGQILIEQPRGGIGVGAKAGRRFDPLA